MNNEMVVFVLSLSVLLLLITNFMQMNKNSSLRNELDERDRRLNDKDRELSGVKNSLSSLMKSKEDMFTVKPGDHGILPDFSLVVTLDSGKKHNYQVTYEVEVVEVSRDKYKVKALDYVSQDSYALDSKNKLGILNVINVKHPWVEKREFELIVDDAKRRADKLDKILS